ncbi:hypothetical protein SPI_04727 [Niveomyces insectorum RCEF 264]|uniref:Uncharacterized protein n=1 Tax=Niveomyces insectorum RCEF 264 TaxID=1081102 RepID=A0A167USQ2_9HYPO|nr:hypothetical protein SPI_04727 [Niveomyces insectorum RCEF 264]
MLSIFYLNTPLLYGEGGEKAFLGLNSETLEVFDDHLVGMTADIRLGGNTGRCYAGWPPARRPGREFGCSSFPLAVGICSRRPGLMQLDLQSGRHLQQRVSMLFGSFNVPAGLQAFFFPETKGLSLEDIDDLFASAIKTWQTGSYAHRPDRLTVLLADAQWGKLQEDEQGKTATATGTAVDTTAAPKESV